MEQPPHSYSHNAETDLFAGLHHCWQYLVAVLPTGQTGFVPSHLCLHSGTIDSLLRTHEVDRKWRTMHKTQQRQSA